MTKYEHLMPAPRIIAIDARDSHVADLNHASPHQFWNSLITNESGDLTGGSVRTRMVDLEIRCATETSRTEPSAKNPAIELSKRDHVTINVEERSETARNKRDVKEHLLHERCSEVRRA